MGKRLEFSRKTKATIRERAAGRCEKCQGALKPSEGEVDHILPCELGGEPTVANGRLLCKVCHNEKTKDDVRRIRKSDKQRDKHSGAIKPEGKIKGAGFAKSEKPERASKASLPPRKLYDRETIEARKRLSREDTAAIKRNKI
jgi:5-methylcytosine-specific restriction enzyme A